MQSIKDQQSLWCENHVHKNHEDSDKSRWFYQKEYENFQKKYQQTKHLKELRELLGITNHNCHNGDYHDNKKKQQKYLAAFSYLISAKYDFFLQLLHVNKLEIIKKVLR